MSIGSEKQQEIAASPKRNLLVVAPPGCGKTELLAKRATILITRLRPNQKILALTFSNRAKQNLTERLRRALGVERYRRYIQVRNFHGHAVQLLRAHGRTIGVDPSFPMPRKDAISAAIRPLIEDLDIGRAREALASAEQALRSAKQLPLDDRSVLVELKRIGNQNALLIERQRQSAGVLHYDDLLRHTQRLLMVEKVVNLYRHHYGAVLVDEFQDLSPQQLEIALSTCVASRTFVGDPLQGIYARAGARPEIVEATLRKICGEPLSLDVSYRSSPAVLRAINSVSSHMGAKPLSAAAPSAWPHGGAAVAVTLETEHDEAEWIVETSKQILESDSRASIGVISRAGWRRSSIDAAFARTTLPYLRWDLAIDDPTILDRLRSAASALPRDAEVSTLESRVLGDIDPGDADTYNLARDAIDHLRGVTPAAGSLSAALKQFKVRDPDTSVGPGAHLLNAHTGKGQQFDWVFVPGFEDFHIPSGFASTNEEAGEELRVLLVMLSRARHGVALSRANHLYSKRKKRWYASGTSPWWEWVAPTCCLDAHEFGYQIAGYARPANAEVPTA